MRVVAVNHITLDGVLQGPGRPDEDTRDGFRHGGWAQQHTDPAMGEAMSERMGEGFSWLFGRRSYEDMLSHWNEVGGPFKDGLNGPTKYVASSHPRHRAAVAQLRPAQRRRSGWCRLAARAARRQPRRHGQRPADPVAAAPRTGRRAVPAGAPAWCSARATASSAPTTRHTPSSLVDCTADRDRGADGDVPARARGCLEHVLVATIARWETSTTSWWWARAAVRSPARRWPPRPGSRSASSRRRR